MCAVSILLRGFACVCGLVCWFVGLVYFSLFPLQVVFERDDPTLSALFDISPLSLDLEFFAQPTAAQITQRVFTKLRRGT
jgi:hypothetical protein